MSQRLIHPPVNRAAFLSRLLAMCWPLKWIHGISDHAIDNYMRILHRFAEERNQ
ncbi:MAG TPA: hypothetical protein VN963_09235 [bacterium]|nr:hypothetical protein [bacterium]